MSLDKSIEHGKEHRNPYHGPKAVDPSCRNHGSCPHCYQNRNYKHRKEEEEMRSKIEEAKETGDEESSVFI